MSESTDNTATAGESTDQTGTEFKPPATQEELNRIVQSRLDRERGKFADYDELKAKATQIDEFQAKNAELATKLQAYEAEKERATLVSEIAEAAKVPASALRGSTRDELEAHAAVLAELIKPSGPVIPGQERTPEKVGDDPLREFTRNLFANSND